MSNPYEEAVKHSLLKLGIYPNPQEFTRIVRDVEESNSLSTLQPDVIPHGLEEQVFQNSVDLLVRGSTYRR